MANISTDEARDKAREDLLTHDLNTMTAKELVAWLRKWYMKAGYKRLCKVLLDTSFGG